MQGLKGLSVNRPHARGEKRETLQTLHTGTPDGAETERDLDAIVLELAAEQLAAAEAAARAECAAAARPLGDAAALLASAAREAAAAGRLAPDRYAAWAQAIGRAAEAVAVLADQLAGPGGSYATTISSWLAEDR